MFFVRCDIRIEKKKIKHEQIYFEPKTTNLLFLQGATRLAKFKRITIFIVIILFID